MALNLTVDDSSPLINYAPNGAWTDTPAGDSLLQSYRAQSLHTTSMQGATATINFNGTAIWLYGGKRPDYGTYSISVDGQMITTGNSTSQEPESQQLLGVASGLNNGAHTVVLTNTGSGSSIDLDSFIFQAQVGSGASVSTTTIDDSDPRFTYTPPSAWQVNTQPNLNFNNTLHFTQSQGASATIEFSGDAIAVYGTTAPDHADVQISLDGQNKTISGGARVLHTQTLVFYADNLGSNQHQLVLSPNQTSSASPFIDIDSVKIFSSSGSSNSNGTNNSGPSLPDNNNNSLPKSHAKSHLPLIIGASVGAVVITILVAFLLFLAHRRRQLKRKSFSPITPTLPLQRAYITERGQQGRSSSHFLDVMLSPARTSRVPGPMPFSMPLSASIMTTTPMTSQPPQGPLPQLPPRVVPRMKIGGHQDGLGSVRGVVGPSRPNRPTSLVLSP